MGIKLATLVQHANSFDTKQAEATQVFIDRQGNISGRSGLGFFRRHFSSARVAENRATLKAFEDSILADPRFRAHKDSRVIADFFQTKWEKGTPLTAREVQAVNHMLGLERGAEVGNELSEHGFFPGIDASGFASFCVGAGMNLDSPEDIKNALKAYYAAQYGEHMIMDALSDAGVPDNLLLTTSKIFMASKAWTSTLDRIFEGDISELRHEDILPELAAGLNEEAELLGQMVGAKGMDKAFLKQMASSDGPRGMPLFNGTLEAIRSGALTAEEGPKFMAHCMTANRTVRTPELLGAAVKDYRISVDAEKIFIPLATANGLPEGVGKALAYHPEFKSRVDSALLEAFPPPAIPTRDQIDSQIQDTATEFLAEKRDAILDLLALAGDGGRIAPEFQERAGEITETFILEMLNPLLAGPDLMEHLLDPAKGPDMELLRKLETFQTALLSCRHTVTGEFGGDDLAAATEKCLAVVMGTMGTEDAPNQLLAGVNRNFSVIGPGMDSMNSSLFANQLKTSSFESSTASINYVQSILRRIAGFAHATSSEMQKEALGINPDESAFIMGLERGPDGGTLPSGDIHQSVRAFGLARGIRIPQTGYAETNRLAESEAQAFTGTGERPAVTDLLRDRAGTAARELGLAQFNPADLDPLALRERIAQAVGSRNAELLTPAQAREIAEQAILEYVRELKSAVDFIAGLPTEHDPAVPDQFVVSPEEKQRLLRMIPGTPLRDPELIKTVVLESRALTEPLGKLAVPGLSADGMTEALMSAGTAHMSLLGSFQARGAVKDQTHAAYRAALLLTVDGLQLTPSQAADIFDMVSGPQGKEAGRGFTRLSELCDALGTTTGARQKEELLASRAALDGLRMIMGPRVGAQVEEDPSYYSGLADARDISGTVWKNAHNVLHMKSTEFPGYEALSMVVPKLTHAQWDHLMPIMTMVCKNFTDPFDHDYVLKMVAANARELLDAVEANRGTPLSPAQIWQTVLGSKPPRDLTGDNLGARMYSQASQFLFERANAMFPQFTYSMIKSLLEGNLSHGIPFQSLYNAYRPGGRIDLADFRCEQPAMSSLARYTPDNAYGLTIDWARRMPGANGEPSMMTINTGAGRGVMMTHHPLDSKENTPDNPIFVRIMETCRSVCRSDLQFRRVMQALSQASTVNLRILAENLPGIPFSEHSHFDSTVTPQPNGDVVVELANGPDDRPCGARMRIVVTPTGEHSITGMELELRG